jgi:hypothetical protein
MNDYKTLAQILGLNAMSIGCLAQIEAMKADNERGRLNGANLMYGHGDFVRVQAHLHDISTQLLKLADAKSESKNPTPVTKGEMIAAFEKAFNRKWGSDQDSAAREIAFKNGWNAAIKAVQNKLKKEA